jgi:hypothetical protein
MDRLLSSEPEPEPTNEDPIETRDDSTVAPDPTTPVELSLSSDPIVNDPKPVVIEDDFGFPSSEIPSNGDPIQPHGDPIEVFFPRDDSTVTLDTTTPVDLSLSSDPIVSNTPNDINRTM